jgi:hypothetical protein
LQFGFSVLETYSAPNVIEIVRPNVCGPTWRVRGGAGGAEVTLIRATRSSINVVYAQLMLDIGPQRFVEVAEDLGIGEGRIAPVCAAILGTEDVNMVEMATVYSTFARSGVRIDPVMVTRINNQDGTALYEDQKDTLAALDRSVADQLSWVLSGVISGGTGTNADFGRPAAGKTGTAQNFADATFMGYTPQRATAVWVGFPEAQIPMVPPTTDIRIFGGTYPAAIWREIMTAAHDGIEVSEFPGPPASTPPPRREPPLPDSVEVPVLIGREWNEEEILALLGESTLLVSAIEVESTEYEPGTIINQAPMGGEFQPGGSTITIEVAVAPPPPVLFDISSVIGLTEAEAKQVLAGNGFGVNTILEQLVADDDNDNLEPGIVWQQDPPGGGTLEFGQSVTIWVNPIS